MQLIRLIFLLLTVTLTRPYWGSPQWVATICGVFMVVTIYDIFWQRRDLGQALAIYVGVVAGLIPACLISLVLRSLPIPTAYLPAIDGLLAIVCTYLCVSVLWQGRSELRGWLTKRRVTGDESSPAGQPWLLDTSAVIDGRIADLVETGAVGGPLVAPAFVVAELQKIADNTDRSRRARGRRGLDVLNRLRNNPRAQLQIDERELPEFDGQPVDTRLVLLARHLAAKVVTHDYNLNKVAQVHGIEVVNLNDVAAALKPVFLPGEQLEVHLLKPGEAAGQGVGYLEDGTMIVVEGGRDKINETVKVTVTSVLQTSAGRMIFGKC